MSAADREKVNDHEATLAFLSREPAKTLQRDGNFKRTVVGTLRRFS